MYKIFENLMLFSQQYDIITNEYRTIYNLFNEDIICDKILHRTLPKAAFNLSRLDIYNALKPNSQIITDEWLSTDMVEELSQDWFWPYMNENIRIIIPNYLILTEPYLKALINYCDSNGIDTFTDKENSYIYVNEIYPEHQAIFDMYSEIKIETK